MNNVFEKNIQALTIKNKELAIKLASYQLSETPQLVNKNGFFNIIYKNTPLHSIVNPLMEAKEIFTRAENSPVTIHLIYGSGLGYLFQIASANSRGTVILYEPNLNILKLAFSFVDFTKDILKNNVYITDNIEQVGEYLYKNSNTKNTPLMLTTKAYIELDESKFDELVENLQRMVGSYGLDLKYTQEKFYSLSCRIIKNIPLLAKEIPLNTIKDFYKNQTAVVVSAGPTLDRNIEILKKYRDNIVIIVVGTAVKTLIKNGITPDFLCIIEAYDSSKQIEGLDLSQVNFITEPYSNPNLRNFKFKQIYSHISDNMPINHFWGSLINENTQEYLSKGTVSYTALNTARILGCSQIVLVGQDLAYIEGQCYSKDSAYKDLVCKYNEKNKKWEITAENFEEFVASLSNSPDEAKRKDAAIRRLENLNKSLYYVKSINGDKIPTESVYAAFIRPLTEFTKQFIDRKYINTSLVGAQIDGFDNIPLEEALKNTSKISNRELNPSYQINYNCLKSNIQTNIDQLANIKNEIKNGQQALKSLNNTILRYRAPNVDVLKGLKKITEIFLKISSVNKDTLFDFITASEKINVDYEIKMTKNFDIKAINQLTEKFTAYFNTSEKKINYVTKLLKLSLEGLE